MFCGVGVKRVCLMSIPQARRWPGLSRLYGRLRPHHKLTAADMADIHEALSRLVVYVELRHWNTAKGQALLKRYRELVELTDVSTGGF